MSHDVTPPTASRHWLIQDDEKDLTNDPAWMGSIRRFAAILITQTVVIYFDLAAMLTDTISVTRMRATSVVSVYLLEVSCLGIACVVHSSWLQCGVCWG